MNEDLLEQTVKEAVGERAYTMRITIPSLLSAWFLMEAIRAFQAHSWFTGILAALIVAAIILAQSGKRIHLGSIVIGGW